jgi:hypothetical protein
MRRSQYTEEYMKEALERLKIGKRPITPATFLTGRLSGNAAGWVSRYIKSLEKSLIRAGWKPGESQHGSIAYYPPAQKEEV